MAAIVYLAVNRVNGKKYVGITRKSLAERKRRHFGDAKRGSKTIFAHAIRKYGGDIEFSVVTYCQSYEDAQKEEIRLIAEIKPEYNITKGGGGALGLKHKPETLEKMRKAKLGKPGYWRGKKRPEMAEGARERLLINPLNFWLGKERPDQFKGVRCKEDGTVFPSVSMAAQHFGVTVGHISNVLAGRVGTVRGKTIEYCGRS